VSRLTIPIAALFLGLCLAGACRSASTVPSAGTETNWLKTCHTDAECGAMQCSCGVCSHECAADRDCAMGRCAAPGTPALTSLCQSSAAAGLCLPACDDATPCATGQICSSGSCVPELSTAEGGNAGATSQSSAGAPDAAAAAGGSPGLIAPDLNCADAKPGSWVTMPALSAPVADDHDEVVWTGSEMLVVETVPHPGQQASGRFDACQNNWQALAERGEELYAPSFQVPGGLLYFETVPVSLGWASRLTLLDLASNQWLPLAVDSEPPNQKRAVVWTGKKLIWWGGALQHPDVVGPGHWEDRNDGGVYDFAAHSWQRMSTRGAPAGRTVDGNAVWTGDKLVVWGGASAVDPTATTSLDSCFYGGSYEPCHRFADGAVYDLASDTWTPISTVGAPSARVFQHMVWTGKDVLVIGGANYTAAGIWTEFADAYRYQIAEDRWSTIALPQQLSDDILVRSRAAGSPDLFEWTGSHALLKIPVNQIMPSPTYSYDPVADSWQVVADPPNGASCPPAKSQGICLTPNGTRYFGLYRPTENAWTLLDYPVRDAALVATHTLWTGSQLLEWGGYRLGSAPDAGPCPAGSGCDPNGAPRIFTADGAVFTPP